MFHGVMVSQRGRACYEEGTVNRQYWGKRVNSSWGNWLGLSEVVGSQSAQEARMGLEQTVVGFMEGTVLSMGKWNRGMGTGVLRGWKVAQVAGIRGMW